MADKTSGADFFAGFFVGALVGAAAALLLAPLSGEETRALIQEKGIELQERAGEMSADARTRATELQIQARDATGQLSVQTKEKATVWQTKMKEAVSDGQAAGSQKKEDLLVSLDEQSEEDQPPAAA